jgi:hypothetical protein
MDREFPNIEWDGCEAGAVLDWWTQLDKVAGTFWRLILESGKTLVVEPYQTKSCPAPHIESLGAPERIDPIYAGVNGSGEFAKAVYGVARESTSETRQKLQEVLEKHGVADLEKRKLMPLCSFIHSEFGQEVEPLPESWGKLVEVSPWLDTISLKMVVEKLKELTGVDIRESLLRAFAMESQWSAYIGEWVRDTANDFRFGEDEARRNLGKHVHWVACFTGGKRWLVKSFKMVGHSFEDRARLPNAEPEIVAKKDESIPPEKYIAEGNSFAIGEDYNSLLDKSEQRLHKPIPPLGISALRAFHQNALGRDNRKELHQLRDLDHVLGSYTGRQFVSAWFDFLKKDRRGKLIKKDGRGKYWMEL